MAAWFGKTGMGMHIMCVILRDNDDELKKVTYISFTGKAVQDVGTVMAVYKSVLQQVSFS